MPDHFLWTPLHFWALALYRTEDYRAPALAHVARHARLGLHLAPDRPYIGHLAAALCCLHLPDERLDHPASALVLGVWFLVLPWLWQQDDIRLPLRIWHLSPLLRPCQVDYPLPWQQGWLRWQADRVALEGLAPMPPDLVCSAVPCLACIGTGCGGGLMAALAGLLRPGSATKAAFHSTDITG